ncbi:MAG: anti-sigma factor antagonist [Calditrichaeota bacterium]|nr:MAG: anti-sigma factor antagonist [Calditrichota bacterium]MBL1205780.1 anti-sigma factor antagonist [Calditrichota bacterium]NOG45608.1 STAS domain-containing protein [Calditrichota bacterium]
MEAEFKLTSELHNDVLVLHTSGYVNNEGGEKIATEFSGHFEKGIKKVVINLEKSKVVNSIGISFLIEVIEKLNEEDGKLVFTNLEPAIDKTLTIMGLFNYAEKDSTVESALKSLA